MQLSAGDRLGKYEIAGRLAVGGMAEVYLAKSLGHGGFSKTIVLKRMLPDLAAEPGFREMFMQEASVTASLSHPNIVQIFDFAEDRGELYLAMEFVQGVTLRALNTDLHIKHSKPLVMKPVMAAHIARSIAFALSYAWQVPDGEGKPSHIIHRDVTPHNILLSHEGAIKLADFGIAKPAERSTSVGTVKGKLLYMSPEQLMGGTLDARSDVFALGIVLYETATSHKGHLFDGKTQDDVRTKVMTRFIMPPVRVFTDFPPLLSAVIMKALERKPEARFQTAAEFAEALGEAIHKETQSPVDLDLPAFMKRVYGDAPALNLRPVEPSLVSAQLVEELEGTQNERKGKSAAQQKKPEVVAPPPAPIAPKLSPEEELQKRGNDTRGETLLQRKGSEPRGAKPTVLLTREQIAAVANRRPTVGMRRGARAGIGALAVVALSGLLLIARAKLSPTGPVERAPVLSAGRQPDPPRPEPILEPVPSVAERKLELPPVIVEKAPPLPPLEDKKPIAAPVKPVAARLPPLPVVAAGPVDVTVRLSAWAYVWADGETFNTGREVAPPATRVLKLAPGAHVVHLSNDDTGVKKFDVAVLVRPGKPVRIEGTADHAAVKE